MLGIIPAAGAGSRIQPLAFSKELLPVGLRRDHGVERPRAVSEYVVERLVTGGATRICFVISPDKTDIMRYYGDRAGGVPVCYVVQPRPAGLCDAIFSARPFLDEREDVAVGLPDTVWFPRQALAWLPRGAFAFLLFPVSHPERFDAVVADDEGRVLEVQVKTTAARTNLVWGAWKAPARTFRALAELWEARGRRDEYFGYLTNAYLDGGGHAIAVRAGTSYVDVGTVGGYREAIAVLEEAERRDEQDDAIEEPHETAK